MRVGSCFGEMRSLENFVLRLLGGEGFRVGMNASCFFFVFYSRLLNYKSLCRRLQICFDFAPLARPQAFPDLNKVVRVEGRAV